MYGGLGITAAVTMLSHFVFILISFRLLTAVRFDKLLRPNHVRESQLLMVFVAIALGFAVSEFFLSLLGAARDLQYLL
ncbi:DUF1146 family protein [Lacticaseibacillus parakribbianus]|uniref:DUF1146 family protein n=1 Tax=Lacticaseibacillus parakribbianus TaxID=2970927 RepID=UPI0021CB864B|nr:DUF1146 family protein [Lacticaseibacillus parakribbianus]